MGDVDFHVVMAVNDSWNQIRSIPNYDVVAGEMLFRKIFELAPAALDMYSFGPKYVGREEELYSSLAFRQHSTGVVNMLDAAISMLGPDLEDAAQPLADLGAKHVAYGVLPAHYGIVGEALLHTLETALGKDAWTPVVKRGWTMVYAFLSTAMLAGANRRVEKNRKKKAWLASLNEELEEVEQNNNKREMQQREESSLDDELFQFDKDSTLTPASQRRLEDLAEYLEKDKETTSDMRDDVTNTTIGTTDDLSLGDGIQLTMMEEVSTSWDIVRQIPNYKEVAGVLLFKNIFEIAPAAKDLFPFAQQYKNDDEALFKAPVFVAHAKSVVKMLDLAVNLLGPDLEPVTRALEQLGARHEQYNVVSEHYPIVGEALLKTLEAALGDKWTPSLKQGWASIFTFISTSMQNGAGNSASESVEDHVEI